jgi:hypothetical protein
MIINVYSTYYFVYYYIICECVSLLLLYILERVRAKSNLVK